MKLVVANHKMNLTLPEVLEYRTMVEEIDKDHIKLVICPSYPYLNYFQSHDYQLGSQNVAMLEEGSLTGEVSAKQLYFLHVKYTLVGHYERRKYLGETDIILCYKIKQLLKVGIKPIFCIGETVEQRDQGQTKSYLKEELESVMKCYSKTELEKIIVAYEPIWSIETGNIPTNEQIEDTIKFIKETIVDNYNISLPVLYGGSINPDTIDRLEEIKSLDGYLIGNSSLNPTKLKEMIVKIK